MKSMDLDSYRGVLRSMASNSSSDYVKADSNEAERIIVAELFHKANKSAIVVSQKLRTDLFCSTEVLKEVRDFVEIRGGHLKVIVKELGGCEEELRDALGFDDDDDHFVLYHYTSDLMSSNVEFTCVDREAFVIKTFGEIGALAAFNRPDAASKIANHFSDMLKKSRKLVLAD